MKAAAPFELEGSRLASSGASALDTSVLNRQPSDDGVSVMSFQSQKSHSTTDGIDILGPERSYTFVNWNESWTGKILTDVRFNRAVVFFILLDSFLMGLATFDIVTESERNRKIAMGVNSFLLSLFTIELAMRLIHHKFQLWHHGWVVFDLLVISSSWIFSFLTVVRAFRVVRSLRLATRIKELRNVILAFHEVVPKIVSVAFILALSFYIFSIMFTDLYKDLYQEGYTSQNYFSSIDVTAFTLFQIMTLDQWSTITKEVQAADPWAWVFFVAFVVTSTFFILNLTVAVVYEALIRVQEQQTSDPPIAVVDPVHDSLLEQKVDMLAETVESLLRQQMMLQSSISEMSQASRAY